jgi:deazaflavin-dependent oxidoreductase (nitroreductase family)
MRLYRRLIHRLGHLRLFAWMGVHIFTPLDKRLYPRTQGRVISAGPPILPVLMLTTVGRKTGALHTTPLLYVEDGEDLVIVGSNWGQRHHPAWSFNLLTHPKARVQVGRETREVDARLASPAERTRLWPRLVSIWPPYETYAQRSGRDLRMFVLSPARS